MVQTPQNTSNTLTIDKSDPETSYGTIFLPNKVLRTLKDENCAGTFIDTLNTHLKYVKIRQYEQLETRLTAEYHKVVTNFRTFKGGSCRSKFDLKSRSKNIPFSEIEQTDTNPLPTPTSYSTSAVNTGARLDNASPSYKRVLLKRMEDNVEKALECVETFDGERCLVNINGQTTSRSFESMPSTAQKNVKQVMHVCDTAMISDAAYHLIAMKSNELTRKHHIVACRQQINSMFDVKRTPGMLPGSYLSFTSELSRHVLQAKSKGDFVPTKLQIKLSGDGTRLSRVSDFIVVSYALLHEQSNSHLQQKVLAVVKCDENYENLEKTLDPLFQEVNERNRDSTIKIGEHEYEMEIFIGGDMKFIQILLGLNGSLGNYAWCPRCKVHQNDRGNISHPCSFYNSKDFFRSITEITELASASSKVKYGVKRKPLLRLEIDHFDPDELHLLMRVMDVLIRNVIYDAKSKDDFVKITSGPADNLELLENAIQSCGVKFKIWTNKTGETEWTSLCGNDMKKVLIGLPDKILFWIHQDTQEMVCDIW